MVDEVLTVGEEFVEFADLNNQYFGSQIRGTVNYRDWSPANGRVYWDVDSLLRYEPNKQSVPDRFYVVSLDLMYPDDESLGEIQNYFDVVYVVKRIIDYADFNCIVNQDVTERMVFFHKSRFEIELIYNSSSLQVGLDGISIFKSYFEDKTHEEHKKSIFKDVLYGLVINVDQSERLRYLLKSFGEFSRRLNENYQLYVSEFSFDEVRNELEEKKRKYIVDINTTFSALSAKLFSVPLAFYVAYRN